MIGPAGGDALGAFRRTAVQQHHVGMLGVDLVEPVPDRAMVVEVEATGEGDLRPCGKKHFRLGPSLDGEEIALSIMAEVSVRWLTCDPERGRQDEPL